MPRQNLVPMILDSQLHNFEYGMDNNHGQTSKKTAKQLKQEMLEMTQALEKIRQEKINVYGEIFLTIVESINDAERAEAYFKILDANATKIQKKVLADDIEDLKKLAGIIDKATTKMNSTTPSDSENTNAVSSGNLGSGDKKIDEHLTNSAIGNS